MSPIIPPDQNPWRIPSEPPGFVTVRQSPTGDYEVILRPGASPVDLTSALLAVSVNTVFTDAYGDVDVLMLFRSISGTPPALLPAGIGNPPGMPAMR
ncbi:MULTISPECIES: hypothetical protein [unclassified Frankia]|uniref:hypothetical protein n=1 Tax=unclassified Frankia TaxID=2632575 RepID=UPI001EF5740C|nr:MULTISPECIES: hypothetical protein [unclassified Frankia]